MSTTNLNTYAGAFLGTVFVMMTVGILGEAIFSSETPEQPGYAIAAAEGGAASESGGAAAAPAVEPVSALLATADVAAGENVFKKCAACHTVEEGGPNKVGPNLWGVVGRPVASHEGFKYSSAMTAFGADGKVWDYEHLNLFTHKPKDLVPGTAMGFAGLPKVQDRADLIAYLRTQSSNPVPLPSADAAPAADAAAPAATDTAAPAATDAAPAATGTAPAATETAPAAPAATETAPAPSGTAPAATEGTTTQQ